MAAVLGFAIYQLGGLLASDYRPITPTGSWMGMTIINKSGQTITLCTDPDDARTAVDIPDTEGFSIQAIMAGGVAAVRFQAGVPAFYLKTASGDGTGAYCTWA